MRREISKLANEQEKRDKEQKKVRLRERLEAERIYKETGRRHLERYRTPLTKEQKELMKELDND